MPLEEVWTKHSFTPIVNWSGAYKMWKANPVAQACTITYSLMMPEAQLGVVTPSGYSYDDPIVTMLTRNQWRVTMSEIMTILCIGGNAYGYKLRNASGAVIGIRWYSDKHFAPVNDGWGDVDYYHYYNGAVTYSVPKEDVVHIVGFWYDPEKPLGGGSPVELAAQSIEGYNEASATVFNIHKNDAMPKTIVVYDEELTPEQVSLAERSFKRKYGGDRRGSVGIMWGVKDVKRLALDWNELGLSDTFGQYETRICGAYKVHPIIAGTHMGLSQSTYSNFEQASKDYTNMVRVPFWNMLADQINAQLAIPDYGVEIGFDLSTVQALAGDAIATEAVSTQDANVNGDNSSDGGAVPVEARGFRGISTKIRSGEEAVIVDIDDTLLTSTGNPKQNVIDYVNAKHAEYMIHIVTGRMIDDRDRTVRELEDAGVKYDELHLNDTTAPTIVWKEYKAKKIQEMHPVDLAIDNDEETRAMYRSLGIDTLNPSDIPEIDSKQYEGIDFLPPKGVRDEAAKGLEWRREYNRGGTAVGVARARDLSNGRAISPDTARRMNSYFARHEVDKQGEGWSPGQEGFPSAGRIAWALWGGDAGQRWSAKLVEQMNAEDEQKALFKSDVKSWLQHPDSHVYSKQYDEALKPYDDRIAKSWSMVAMELATYLRDTKSAWAVETKAEDFSEDFWTEKFLRETETDREELVELVIKLAQEEVDAEPGDFAKAREAGIIESSNKISDSVPTLRADVQKVVLENPGISDEELSKLLFDKVKGISQARANMIARTTVTATTGATQKSVWDELGGIRRSWAALAGARAAHAAAHDSLEDDNGLFTVGGEQTPYPAGDGLSAANSVNCRCFARARRAV